MTDHEILKAEFIDLNSIITIHIFRDLNPELWEAFKSKLPFTGIATHSVVSGLNITCWTPVYATVPITTMELINEMPVGRVFLSGSGNKILFKYGLQTEWVSCPPIGMVEGQDLVELQKLGPIIWESVFFTKRLYHLTFSLG